MCCCLGFFYGLCAVYVDVGFLLRKVYCCVVRYFLYWQCVENCCRGFVYGQGSVGDLDFFCLWTVCRIIGGVVLFMENELYVLWRGSFLC